MKGVDQRVNGGQAVFFRKIGEVSIPRGCYGTGMPENGLDMTKT
jgi:hypothetical protein